MLSVGALSLKGGAVNITNIMNNELMELEARINNGISTLIELEDICLKLIKFCEDHKGEEELVRQADDLMEILRPQWSSEDFHDWLNREIDVEY
ncbi:hypothetical protein FJR11_19530 [Anabaena sp. UHCC 0187]|nr:hypothetical protein [Anabaena sp. UHCC 0187]